MDAEANSSGGNVPLATNKSSAPSPSGNGSMRFRDTSRSREMR
jgi:hypothetical protein